MGGIKNVESANKKLKNVEIYCVEKLGQVLDDTINKIRTLYTKEIDRLSDEMTLSEFLDITPPTKEDIWSPLIEKNILVGIYTCIDNEIIKLDSKVKCEELNIEEHNIEFIQSILNTIKVHENK